MNLLRNIFRRLGQLISTLGRTIEISAAIVAVLSAIGLGSAITGYISHIPSLIILGLVILVLSAALFVFVYSILEERKHNLSVAQAQNPPKVEQPSDVVYLWKELTYEYADQGPVSFLRRCRFRVLRNGVHSVSDRYLWTGTGTCNIESMTHGFTLSNQRREEVWNFYDVVFDPAFENDELEFVLKWTLFDKRNTAVPFLSTRVDVPTELISLRVILPVPPKVAFFYEFDNYIDNLPSYRKTLQWDPATKSIYYEVANPKLDHKLLIKWSNE